MSESLLYIRYSYTFHLDWAPGDIIYPLPPADRTFGAGASGVLVSPYFFLGAGHSYQWGAYRPSDFIGDTRWQLQAYNATAYLGANPDHTSSPPSTTYQRPYLPRNYDVVNGERYADGSPSFDNDIAVFKLDDKLAEQKGEDLAFFVDGPINQPVVIEGFPAGVRTLYETNIIQHNSNGTMRLQLGFQPVEGLYMEMTGLGDMS